MKPEPIALFGSRVHARGEGPSHPLRALPQALEEISMAESTAQLNELYQQAQESERAAAQRQVAGILTTIDAELREHVQRSTVESVRKIIDRLNSGADLSDEDTSSSSCGSWGMRWLTRTPRTTCRGGRPISSESWVWRARQNRISVRVQALVALPSRVEGT